MTFYPIPDFEGMYEINEYGIVRSVDRTVIGADGVSYPFKGKLIKLQPNSATGYLQVHLYKNNKQYTRYVHIIVAQVFIPNPNKLPEVNHKDGNRGNPVKSNLEWVTSSGNSQHAVDTGLRVYTNRLNQKEFMECLLAVINGESYASVSQRVPYKVPFLSTKLRKIARQNDLEDLLDESLMQQRVERARINGNPNK